MDTQKFRESFRERFHPNVEVTEEDLRLDPALTHWVGREEWGAWKGVIKARGSWEGKLALWSRGSVFMK